MLALDEPTVRDISAVLRKLQDGPLNDLVLRHSKRSFKGQLCHVSGSLPYKPIISAYGTALVRRKPA